jgi:hypothetical protein
MYQSVRAGSLTAHVYKIQQKRKNFNLFDFLQKNVILYSESSPSITTKPKPNMPHVEVVYLFKGVKSSHRRILDNFNSRKHAQPEVVYRVSASSQSALPSTDEMHLIPGRCSNIHFPPSIKFALAGSRKKILLDEMMRGAGMASIFYVDKGARILYNGSRIKMGNHLAMRVVIHDNSVARCEPLCVRRVRSRRREMMAA